MYSLIPFVIPILSCSFELNLNRVPPEFVPLVRDVASINPSRREHAAKSIARQPLALAYYRANAKEFAALDKYARNRINEQILPAVFEMLPRRAEAWIKQKRIDLFIEYAGALQEEDNQRLLYDSIHEIVKDVIKNNVEHRYLSRIAVHRHVMMSSFREIRARKPFTLIFDNSISLNDFYTDRKMIFSQSIKSSVVKFMDCIMVSTGAIKENASRSEWRSSLIISNTSQISSMRKHIQDSLIIIDGDVEWKEFTLIRSSIIISHGKLTSTARLAISDSYLSAKGPIDFPQLEAANCFLHSPKTITIPKALPQQPQPMDDPFGIRFFELSDVGLEVRKQPLGIEITKIAPFSPLRLFGLRIGDVITKVEERTIDSEDTLRRAIRSAYVREAGVFHLIRDRQKIERIVVFSGYQLPE